MISIFGSALWLLSVMQRLSSWTKRALRSSQVAPLKTATQSPALSGSWRHLTSNSSGRGSRYLVRHAASSNTYAIYVYDLRTSLTWRCDFFSQLERNTYLNDLRAGGTQTWPSILVHVPDPKQTPCELL
ncbi:MAG: hypothetical protein ACO39R_06650 [Pontimonas sp.]